MRSLHSAHVPEKAGEQLLAASRRIGEARSRCTAESTVSACTSVSTLSSPACRSLAQAPMTKGSFTLTQAIVSTPLALSCSALPMKPGAWSLLQVGVKAPGTAKITTCANTGQNVCYWEVVYRQLHVRHTGADSWLSLAIVPGMRGCVARRLLAPSSPSCPHTTRLS